MPSLISDPDKSPTIKLIWAVNFTGQANVISSWEGGPLRPQFYLNLCISV